MNITIEVVGKNEKKRAKNGPTDKNIFHAIK
jgi:hypothetical protein